MGPEMIKESFLNVSCFFVFGYLQVFLREVIASASLDAFAESSVAMKQAMVVSGMSHVMVKLFAPWVSWKVLPYSGKIALLFVLHTVAFSIIVVANQCRSRVKIIGGAHHERQSHEVLGSPGECSSGKFLLGGPGPPRPLPTLRHC